jgi:hypothetical protein
MIILNEDTIILSTNTGVCRNRGITCATNKNFFYEVVKASNKIGENRMKGIYD